jgi:hypothetical protein
MPKFNSNPLVQIIVGFFLFFYGMRQESGDALINYGWLAAAIVGFAIFGNGVRKLRKSTGEIDQDRFKQ